MKGVIYPKNKTSDVCFILYGSRYAANMKSFSIKQLYKNFYNKTLISLQLDAILSVYPNAEIILVIGNDGDRVLKLEDHRVRFVENQLSQDTNEVEDIRIALNNTHCKNAFLINSDLYFNKSSLIDITSSTILYDTRNQLDNFEMGVVVTNNLATHLDFKLDKKWCNIVSLYGESLKAFKTVCNRNNNKLFLFEIINTMLDRGVKIEAKEPPSMVVHKIDTPQKYRNFTSNPHYI